MKTIKLQSPNYLFLIKLINALREVFLYPVVGIEINAYPLGFQADVNFIEIKGRVV